MNEQKTYVFDLNGEFLRARQTKAKAVASSKEPFCFFFSQKEVKDGVHTRFFKKMKKFQKKF